MTGKEIRRLRRSLDITQKQLAKIVGVQRPNISQVECDVRTGPLRNRVIQALQTLQAEAEQQQAA